MSSFTIGNSLTSIGSHCFSGSGLTSIDIPDNVTTIGEGAFYNCSQLVNANIGKGIKELDRELFMYCSSLNTVILPENLTRLGSSVFQYCTSLFTISIPNGVTYLGFGLFSCSGLTSIVIPNSVNDIEERAFSQCEKLTSIVIPNGVYKVYQYTFYGCSSLTSVVIPETVDYIALRAFGGCKELTDVYCYAKNVPGIEPEAFKDSYIDYATLHVPSSSLEDYKIADTWKNFGKILALTAEDPGPSGLYSTQITGLATPSVYYSIDGKQSSQAQHGLNIIRMNDGSTRKIMVK